MNRRDALKAIAAAPIVGRLPTCDTQALIAALSRPAHPIDVEPMTVDEIAEEFGIKRELLPETPEKKGEA